MEYNSISKKEGSIAMEALFEIFGEVVLELIFEPLFHIWVAISLCFIPAKYVEKKWAENVCTGVSCVSFLYVIGGIIAGIVLLCFSHPVLGAIFLATAGAILICQIVLGIICAVQKRPLMLNL